MLRRRESFLVFPPSTGRSLPLSFSCCERTEERAFFLSFSCIIGASCTGRDHSIILARILIWPMVIIRDHENVSAIELDAALSACACCAGNKMNNVEVIYTPWSNLKKSPSMDVGQVGFHNPRMVISHHYYCSYISHHFFFALSLSLQIWDSYRILGQVGERSHVPST